MRSFSSKIHIIGVNPYVEVPTDILKTLLHQAMKKSGPIPVKGLLNRKPFTQTVVKFSGMWRLYLNTPMRNATKLKVGDIAHVEIEFDAQTREEKMPEKLAQVLSADKKASEVFENFPPYRKKEILRYLNSLKKEEPLEKNIEKVMRHLRGEKVDGLLALTYRDKKPKKGIKG